MPNSKKAKVKEKVVKKGKAHDEADPILDLEEPEEGDLQPDEELDPEVIEALKLKNKKQKKPTHETDYIPELERGEIDFDLKMDEDY